MALNIFTKWPFLLHIKSLLNVSSRTSNVKRKLGLPPTSLLRRYCKTSPQAFQSEELVITLKLVIGFEFSIAMAMMELDCTVQRSSWSKFSLGVKVNLSVLAM